MGIVLSRSAPACRDAQAFTGGLCKHNFFGMSMSGAALLDTPKCIFYTHCSEPVGLLFQPAGGVLSDFSAKRDTWWCILFAAGIVLSVIMVMRVGIGYDAADLLAREVPP